jgi:hypothetical protein
LLLLLLMMLHQLMLLLRLQSERIEECRSSSSSRSRDV